MALFGLVSCLCRTCGLPWVTTIERIRNRGKRCPFCGGTDVKASAMLRRALTDPAAADRERDAA